MGFKHHGKRTAYVQEANFGSVPHLANLRTALPWGNKADQFRLDIGATWTAEKLKTANLLNLDTRVVGPNSVILTDTNSDSQNSELDGSVDTTTVNFYAEGSTFTDDEITRKMFLEFPEEDTIYPYHSVGFSELLSAPSSWPTSTAKKQIITVFSREYNAADLPPGGQTATGEIISLAWANYLSWINGTTNLETAMHPELARKRLRNKHTSYAHFIWALTGIMFRGYGATGTSGMTYNPAYLNEYTKNLTSESIAEQMEILEAAGGLDVSDPNFEDKKVMGTFLSNMPTDLLKLVTHLWLGAANPNKQGIKMPGGWSNTPPGTFTTDKWFYDYYVELPTPFDLREREEVPGMKNIPLPLSIDLDCRYQFFSSQYENFTAWSGLSEPFLPNMYSILSHFEGGPTYDGIGILSTMAGSLNVDFVNEQGEKTDNFINHNYFDSYATVLGSTPNIAIVDAAAHHFNIGFTTDNIRYLTDYNTKVNMFPMYVDIQIATQRNANLVEQFAYFGYDSVILKKIMEANINRAQTGALDGFDVKTFRKSGTIVEIQDTLDSPTTLVSYEVPRAVQCLDLMSWLEDYNTNGESVWSESAEKYMVFMGDHAGHVTYDVNDTSSSKSDFFRNLTNRLLSLKLKKLALDKMRSMDEIVTGKPAYNEILCYRIAKHEIVNDGINNVPIQNFYFMNGNKMDILKYFDTQIIFGKKYKYVIYAYCMIVGTKYRYNSIEADNTYGTHNGTTGVWNKTDDGGQEFVADNGWLGATGTAVDSGAPYHYKASAHCILEPHIVLAEIPYYGLEANEDTMVTVYDDPPVHPDVTIVPVRGSTKKLLINLSSNYGEYLLPPVAIEDEEAARYNFIRDYQRLDFTQVEKNLIRFKTDDPSVSFQIYRIGPDPVLNRTPRPYSYHDFKGKKLKTIGTEGAASAAFMDRIIPNKKYYYMFRSIDIHGNISYPTEVYEVQLVSEPGGELGYPIIKTIDFQERLKPRWSRSMRKFLHIEPDPAQTYMNIDSIDDIDVESAKTISPMLGVVQDPLFIQKDETNTARRFKIRLTSRQSGKKIDFNVRFVHDHKKILEEE